LKRMLDNLVARLGCRALASGDLGLTMKLSPRGRDVRMVPVAAPTRDVSTLLALVRLALETSPPGNAVEGIVVRTAPARTLAGQGIGGQVLAAAGPFRVRDGWWQLPVTRDYYDVQLSDGAIYRVFHDLHRDSWHIDGCYE